MLFQRLLKGKRANGESTAPSMIERAISFTLTAIIVLAVLGWYVGSSKVLAAGKTAQTGEDALEKVRIALESVANGSSDVAVASQISLKEDQVIIFFRKSDDDVVRETCAVNERVNKPSPLQGCDLPDSLCICIFDEDGLDENPYSCKSIRDNNRFSGAMYAEPYEEFKSNLGATFSEGRAFPVIYADCWSSGEQLAVKNIAIEKVGGDIKISDNACGNKLGECKSVCTRGKTPIESLKHTCTDPRLPICCER